MTDAPRRGGRDESDRSPPHGGERADRSLRVGDGHPSGAPTRPRVFEVRASYDEAAGGWVAQVGELNRNDQLDGWGPEATDGGHPRAFPTPAACLGDAVAVLVAA